MRLSRANSGIWLVAGMLVASLFLPVVSRAQGQTQQQQQQMGPITNSLSSSDTDAQTRELMDKNLRTNFGDPKIEAAYTAFHNAKEAEQKIKLGEDFINKYPTSFHIQGAYEELSQAYYSKQDMPNFYRLSDKGISLYPDDVTLLAITGWVIPRAYENSDPDGDKKLDKAVGYEKHALDVLKTMDKPASLSAQQFDLYRTEESAIAHSALGLVYFRQGQFDDSVKEMQLATQGSSTPDPTDFFVLGADFQNMNQFKEAADAFNRCAQISGPLQAGCKENAQNAAKQAGPAK